ncbi:MAG: DUF4238 domain-containing protein [Candidatus Atribacteria bacterium]|nr:DUF4238 domain-containing protein [Candidatus Atribacteria bacterium]
MQDKKQHYIPQFYLKNFSIIKKLHEDEKPAVFVYDKVEKKLKRKAIKNVGKENHLYSIRDSDDSLNAIIEKQLSKLEGLFSRILLKIDQSYNNGTFYYEFDDDDKAIISYFILWQIKRTPRMKEILKQTLLKKIETDENWLKNPDYKALNNSTIKAMYNAGHTLNIPNYILNRSWNLFYISDESINLITSDNLINYRN